jgi:hypothetical protein
MKMSDDARRSIVAIRGIREYAESSIAAICDIRDPAGKTVSRRSAVSAITRENSIAVNCGICEHVQSHIAAMWEVKGGKVIGQWFAGDI